MGLKYIYTGYCKTGTKTIQEAFKILGYKVYDWEENAMYCADAWIQVFSKTTSSQEKEKLISEMYKDVDVVVEGPNIFYWREILKIFPDCKVIHYQRDEDDWWNSFSKQLNMYNEFNPGVPNWFIYITLIFIPTLGKQSYLYKNHLASLLINQKGNTFIPPWTMELKNVNEFMARRAYRTHNSDVLLNCPKDKLLHLNTINCGWEVLCKFTNQEIPQNTNWPHQNKDGKGLFETRQYTAKDFYDPFAKIENPFMAQIKYEANKNALIMLIAVILIVILATGI